MDKRKTICLLTSEPDTLHSKRICSGVAAQCEKYGYDLAVFSSMLILNFYYKDYARGESNIYSLVNFSKFDGIIVDSINLDHAYNSDIFENIHSRIKEQTSAPTVSIGIPFGDSIVCENSNDAMFRELCSHAVDVHGCKDICILTGPKGSHEAEERLDIMLDEIRRRGLCVTHEHIIYGDFWYTSGIKLAQDMVSGKIPLPDALIAASDHMALGFIEEYTRLGGHVPEDIIVLGFEATREAMLDDITLSSIESNFAKCAADAVDKIRSIIEPESPIFPYETNTDTMLHLGMSCGCAVDMKGTLDAIRSSLYAVTRNFTADIFEHNIDIGMLMESYIPEQLTASQSIHDCIENIYKSSYIISPLKHFYLCLRQDWLDSSADIVEGYPDKMDLVMIKSKDSSEDLKDLDKKITFDTSELIPGFFDKKEEPSVYFFSAVHFGDKTLGYAVLQRKFSDTPKFDLVYRNWLRFVNNALEMARTRNRYVELSIHDKMTGLLNRRGMYGEYEKLTSCFTDKKLMFVAVVDMDGLKYINDTFGHSAGDHGIIRVADAVRAVTDEKDICCRAGGDEFYIIGLRDKERFDSEKYISDFCDILAKLSLADNKPYPVTASIGCSVSTDIAVTDLEALISKADENMYHYKISRRRRREDCT